MRRSSKLQSDSNQAAALTAKLASGEPEASQEVVSAISEYLATIGRKGGIKGGKARAESLTSERKKEIARQAAQARWQDKRA
jgi:ABC-type branched-subunit amino acid transport system substrate-binding protein